MSRRHEDGADEFFRQDAASLGYFVDDAHAPGHGRGLRAYYADFGMVQPEVLERELPGQELTNEIWDRSLHAVELDGQTPATLTTGRHTKGRAADGS